MRRTGTTTIIEDVAFPVARLAGATIELQQLLATHGYAEPLARYLGARGFDSGIIRTAWEGELSGD